MRCNVSTSSSQCGAVRTVVYTVQPQGVPGYARHGTAMHSRGLHGRALSTCSGHEITIAIRLLLQPGPFTEMLPLPWALASSRH